MHRELIFFVIPSEECNDESRNVVYDFEYLPRVCEDVSSQTRGKEYQRSFAFLDSLYFVEIARNDKSSICAICDIQCETITRTSIFVFPMTNAEAP
jgi:hypothetical protein